MPTLVLLGTGAAVSDPHRTTTMLAFSDGASTLVVDCGGDVIQRLMAAGIDVSTISALIVTHEHPDHVSGFPLFMEKIWLAGRRKPIPVYGPKAAVRQAQRCFEVFNTSSWTGMPEIQWKDVALEDGALLMDDTAWHVTAAPGDHGVPVIGIRVRHRKGGTVTYSADTRPSNSILQLARGSDVLVHEATGEGPWHASPEEAAQIAASAGVGRLLLVHLPPGLTNSDLSKARQSFQNVELGEELGQYTF